MMGIRAGGAGCFPQILPGRESSFLCFRTSKSPYAPENRILLFAEACPVNMHVCYLHREEKCARGALPARKINSRPMTMQIQDLFSENDQIEICNA